MARWRPGQVRFPAVQRRLGAVEVDPDRDRGLVHHLVLLHHAHVVGLGLRCCLVRPVEVGPGQSSDPAAAAGGGSSRTRTQTHSCEVAGGASECRLALRMAAFLGMHWTCGGPAGIQRKRVPCRPSQIRGADPPGSCSGWNRDSPCHKIGRMPAAVMQHSLALCVWLHSSGRLAHFQSVCHHFLWTSRTPWHVHEMSSHGLWSMSWSSWAMTSSLGR